ncbi:hypothetical protein BKE30_06205 [Alkanindiges hydrocarboniclasticus]|jgi:uncharacterized membrane protein|uniref:DUF1622 domain-containing protein n=1 Tax=Alkanindiges hydrocarboniclasticus TaxID=1907941 RepID=A0A1S8CVM8_9GAMM|nr:DUF1622 domain-containing protein [Alkanindiges hydrocarboniclasticus]ONG41014.1 hypothetical protein BKE30_06205 [Alkanindiges hydrocarboniclasticus]
MFHDTETFVIQAVSWLRLMVESVGALIIAVGIFAALYGFLKAFIGRHPDGFTPVRLTFARYLALGLEFQLAADILSTAVSPSWEQIGKLAAIAIIRTGLNFFLMKEMQEERAVEPKNKPENINLVISETKPDELPKH